MRLLHDRATLMRALINPSDPTLAQLLSDRLAALSTGAFDLIDHTEIVIIEPGDTEADIIREVGFSPLVEPIDGIRFGSPGFHPFWDWLIGHPGWWEMSVSFGSTYALVLFIENAEGSLRELRELGRRYALPDYDGTHS